MKRYLSIFLAIILAFGCFGILSFAEDVGGEPTPEFTYLENEGNITLTGVTYEGENLVIPETVDEFTVTGIEDFFLENTEIKSVTLPETVEEIGVDAFASTALELIEVDEDNLQYSSVDGVLYNKDQTVLMKCPSAKVLLSEIPETVLVIGENAFMYAALENITLPESVASVGAEAFAYSNLTSVNLGVSVTSLGERAFMGCTALNNVVLSSSLENIPVGCFMNCTSLESIVLPKSVTAIGAVAFYDTSLQKVYLASTVTGIGDFAFGYDFVDDVEFVKNESFEIWGEIETVAETYAADNELQFVNTKLDTAELIEATADNTCVTLSWYPVDSADTYNIYRKTNGGKWELLQNVSNDSTVFCDFEVATGNIYTYTVRALKGECLSGCDKKGVSAEYIKLPTPEMKDATFESGGIRVSWGKIGSAHGYTLFRRTDDTDWEEVDEFSVNKTSYFDTDLESGKTYYYTLTCYRGELISDYDTEGVSAFYLANPVLKSAASSGKGITVKWGKVDGADYYIIGRKTEDGNWVKIAEVEDDTQYTDTAVSVNTLYTYTVVSCSDEVKGFYDEAGIATKYVPTPKLASATRSQNGVTVKWNTVKGANGYYIYRKTADGSYSRIATVKGNSSSSYVDKTAKSGNDYTYTVKGYNGKYLSSYVSKGVSVYYLAAPSLRSAVLSKSGVTVKWNAVQGATTYFVYRKTAGGSWAKVATVKGGDTVSYLDKTAKSTSYIYTVKAYGNGVNSVYNTSGIKTTK